MWPKGGGRRRKIWKASKDVWKPCNPLEIQPSRQSFVWKTLEQKTRVLEKLGKSLGGRLYSATVGSCRQRPPIELDRHSEERSCECDPGVAFVRKRRSNEAVRPAKCGLSVRKSGWPVSSKGTGRRPVRNSQ